MIFSDISTWFYEPQVLMVVVRLDGDDQQAKEEEAEASLDAPGAHHLAYLAPL